MSRAPLRAGAGGELTKAQAEWLVFRLRQHCVLPGDPDYPFGSADEAWAMWETHQDEIERYGLEEYGIEVEPPLFRYE